MTIETRVEQTARGILEIAESVVGQGTEYLRQFAGVAAWHAIAALEREAAGDDLEDALAELEDQTRAVVETLDELTDQAQRRAITRAIMGAVRMAAALATP